VTRYIGVDLAWSEGIDGWRPQETGIVIIDDAGTVVNADGARGIKNIAAWLHRNARPGDVIAINSPLVITNATGMRECERDLAHSYGSWQVYASPTNLTREWTGGVSLRDKLEAIGFVYTDGIAPVAADAISFFECYPYTTLVGAPEFGYDEERPAYKRFDLALPVAHRREFRAEECDELLRKMKRLATSTPALDLSTHPATRPLLGSRSTRDKRQKRREDLADAALCAWTAALWSRHGLERCQILGASAVPDQQGRRPVIIAPARAEQREGAVKPRKRPKPTAQHRAGDALLSAARAIASAADSSDTARYKEARKKLIAALETLDRSHGLPPKGHSAVVQPERIPSREAHEEAH
jgi:predicted RNase H-like nuclease